MAFCVPHKCCARFRGDTAIENRKYLNTLKADRQELALQKESQQNIDPIKIY